MSRLAVLGLLGVVLAILFHEQSFPIASIEFRLLRPQATASAEAYLRSSPSLRKDDLADYRTVVSFQVDRAAQNYLERELGTPALNRLAREEVSVWYWRARFFRELQQEEFEVRLDPTGRIVGFRHLLPEAAPGTDLPMSEAQRLAEEYLTRDRGIRLEDYRLIANSREEKPARTDFIFLWEKENYKLKDATYRLRVTILGQEIGSYNEFLKIPEEWSRLQQEENNRGAVLSRLGWVATFALILALVWAFLLQLKAGRIHWAFALAMLVVLVMVGLATGLNSLPLFLIDYPTTSSLVSYLLERWTATLLDQAPWGAIVVLAGAVGLSLYYQATGPKPAMESFLRLEGLRSQTFVKAIGVGYAMAGIWLGYVVLFYWLGVTVFGVWSPIELPYDNIMSTALPILYPLSVGAGAAISEELFYRLFAVSFLLVLANWAMGRWEKRRRKPLPGPVRVALMATALTIPALVWASLHATYPQQPFFIRAIELSVIGIVSGVIFLKFGIIATITSHYLYNASVVGGLFLLSSNPYLQASAIVAIVLPSLALVPAGVGALRRRPLLRDEELPLEVAPATIPQTTTLPTAPLSRPARVAMEAPRTYLPRRVWIPLALVAAISLALIPLLSPYRLGDNLRLKLTRSEAKHLADGYAQSIGFSVQGWQRASTFQDWSLGNDTAYLLRHLGIQATNDFLEQWLRPYLWEIRYFRSLQKEEMFIRLDSKGKLHSFLHSLPEKAPGANLSQEEARSIAEEFIVGQGLKAEDFNLVSATSQKRDARTDHRFIWEHKHVAVDDGHLRLLVSVAGDAVSEYRFFFKTPEAFDREIAKRNEAQVALDRLRTGVQFLLLILLSATFVLRFRDDKLNLPFAFTIAGTVTVVSFIGGLNGLPALFHDYWSTVSTTNFLIWSAADGITSLLALFAISLVIAGLAESLYRERFPHVPPMALSWQWLTGANRRQWLESVLAALCLSLAALLGIETYHWLQDAVARPSLTPQQAIPLQLLPSFIPAISSLANNTIWATLVPLAIVAIFLQLWNVLGSPRRASVASLVAAALFGTYGTRGLTETLLAAAAWGGTGLLLYYLATTVLRFRIPAYVLVPLFVLTLRDSLWLIMQPSGYYATNGLLLLVVSFLPLAMVWMPRLPIRWKHPQ